MVAAGQCPVNLSDGWILLGKCGLISQSVLPPYKVNLDIFWLRDESVEDIQAALEQFEEIGADLGGYD